MFILTNKTIEKLQHDLVRDGLIDFDGLTFAQDKATQNASNLAEELIKENLISEENLLKFVEEKLHIPFVELSDYSPDIKCLEYVSAENASFHNIFPLFKIEDVLTIAMSDPLDVFTINNLFEDTNITVEPVLASEHSIKNNIQLYYYGQNITKNNSLSWAEMLLSENLTDKILKDTISMIINTAIESDFDNIVMEITQTGMNIFFNDKLQGLVPNLLMQRFLSELKPLLNLDNELSDIPHNARTQYHYNGLTYSIVTSVFPAKYGSRIVLNIYKPLKDITSYNVDLNELNSILEKPALVELKSAEDGDVFEFVYSLAKYLGQNKNVLVAEQNSKYELDNVTQLEFNKNTAVYFDEILNQIELQNFDVIFWEKIYTQEQAKKLALFANEKLIFTLSSESFPEFNATIITNGTIIKI